MAALRERGLWGKTDRMVNVDDDLVARPSRNDEAQERIAAAVAIWRECEMADPTYLRARGITLDIPPSIRFHPALKHTPTGLHLPAMVAAVQAPDRSITAIHRTYLSAGRSRKAGVNCQKMALGPMGNGAVRLAPVGEVLGLAEGIETGLSAMKLFNTPVWCALGSRLHAVTLPQIVREVHIFADNGDAGRAAAEKAADRFTKEGRRVLLRFPPETAGDWNDIIQQGTAA